MPEYLAPGVYVEEVSFRSKSIEGVSTTTTGFIGPTRYGPTDLEPELVTSLGEFERVYGDGRPLEFADTGPIPNFLWHGARAFFEEGGKRLYVVRVFRARRDSNDESTGSAADTRGRGCRSMSCRSRRSGHDHLARAIPWRRGTHARASHGGARTERARCRRRPHHASAPSRMATSSGSPTRTIAAAEWAGVRVEEFFDVQEGEHSGRVLGSRDPDPDILTLRGGSPPDLDPGDASRPGGHADRHRLAGRSGRAVSGLGRPAARSESRALRRARQLLRAVRRNASRRWRRRAPCRSS